VAGVGLTFESMNCLVPACSSFA